MTILRAASVVAVSALAACGDNLRHEAPDAAAVADASRCGMVSTGVVDISGYRKFSTGAERLRWVAPVTGLGSGGNQVQLIFEFWKGIENNLTGTFDLTAGNQFNYLTCGICLLVLELDAQGQVARTFFQSAGSITFSEDPFANQRLVASISNLELQEVVIESNASSTPVPGGTCASVPPLMIDHDRVPNAWTCARGDYDAGGTCNCRCGTPDPECNDDAATVAGCTTGQACFADACVTPPPNDTCATATPLTIGTPMTGTTAGAKRDYNLGLDDPDTCTGSQQLGPDVVYSVTLTGGTPYTVTLSNVAPSYDGAIALVGPGAASLCDASPITTCVAGSDKPEFGKDESFTYTPATTGTYFIIVDGFAASVGGSFTIAVTQ
jgi:hypothetical protein